jgi:hypothetical protein
VNTWKVIFATLVIFGAGIVTGALVVNFSHHFNQPVAVAPATTNAVASRTEVAVQQQTDLLHRMDRQLGLTAEQHKKLEKVLKESQRRTKVIRDQISPHLREEVDRVRREFMAELTPEQQKKFEILPHTGSLLSPRKPERMEDERPPRKKAGEKKKMPTNSVPANPSGE